MLRTQGPAKGGGCSGVRFALLVCVDDVAEQRRRGKLRLFGKHRPPTAKGGGGNEVLGVILSSKQ